MFGSRLLWYGAAVDHEVGEAGDRGLEDAGDALLARSNALVPVLSGDLMESGAVDVNNGEAAVSYSSPYAVIQHEDTAYRHTGGRRAKFLETALDSSSVELFGKIALALRKVMPPIRIRL